MPLCEISNPILSSTWWCGLQTNLHQDSPFSFNSRTIWLTGCGCGLQTDLHRHSPFSSARNLARHSMTGGVKASPGARAGGRGSSSDKHAFGDAGGDDAESDILEVHPLHPTAELHARGCTSHNACLFQGGSLYNLLPRYIPPRMLPRCAKRSGIQRHMVYFIDRG